MYQDKSSTVIVDRRELLKIKSKTYHFEISTIKLEEQRQRHYLTRLSRARAFGPLEIEMRQHRLGLRKLARETHIAYGLVKGKPFQRLESFSFTAPNWDSILKMCLKYGNATIDWKGEIEACGKVWGAQVRPVRTVVDKQPKEELAVV